MPQRLRILERMADQLLKVKQMALKLPPEYRGLQKSLADLSAEVRKARSSLSARLAKQNAGDKPPARR